MPGPEDLTFLERAKIHAEPLVPLVKELESELGTERAHEITRRALSGWIRKMFEALRGPEDNPIAVIAAGIPAFARDAVEYELLEQTDDALDLNVTNCKYAEFYKELGEPDLGYLFHCDLDYAMAEGLGDDLELKRTQTIMRGATHCDFRYRRK